MDSTRLVVENFLYYMQKRDLKNLVSLFADEVEWQIPGNTADIKWLGKRNFKSEVQNFFISLWSATEPLSAEVSKIFVDNFDVVIIGSFNTRMIETNKTVSSIFFIHFFLDKGKIAKYTLLEDSYAVSKSLML